MFARTGVALFLSISLLSSALGVQPPAVAAQAAPARPNAVAAALAARAESEYVPPPPASYALTAADAGPGFREVPPPAPAGEGAYVNRFLAPDVTVDGNFLIFSGTIYSVAE